MYGYAGLRRPAGGVFYHYTTRTSAQEISIAGMILLGKGKIYLTDVLYKFGWQATDSLALPEKNAEVAIAIPESALPTNPDASPAIEYDGVAPEWPATRGRALRRGGGHQWVVRQNILLSVFPWSWVELEVP